MIEYQNYRIERADNLNWSVTVRETAVAERDHKDKQGNVTVQKGEEYERDRVVGYAHDVGGALTIVVRDKAGRGCDTIKDLSRQLTALKTDLMGLCHI